MGYQVTVSILLPALTWHHVDEIVFFDTACFMCSKAPVNMQLMCSIHIKSKSVHFLHCFLKGYNLTFTGNWDLKLIHLGLSSLWLPLLLPYLVLSILKNALKTYHQRQQTANCFLYKYIFGVKLRYVPSYGGQQYIKHFQTRFLTLFIISPSIWTWIF